MKKNCAFVLLILCVLLLAACSKKDKHPEWDESWVRFDDFLAIEPPEGYVLSELHVKPSATGIRYAVWVNGEEREVPDSEGHLIKAYDSQIYFVFTECQYEKYARDSMRSWMKMEGKKYQTGNARDFQVDDQAYRIVSLLAPRENQPYSHGVAAFGSRDKLALSIEVLCSDDFEDSPHTIAEQFLTLLHFGETEQS